MTYVGTIQGARTGSQFSFSTSVNAGDVLVAFISSARLVATSGAADISNLDAPADWTPLRLWSAEPTGSPSVAGMATMILWTRVSSSGSYARSFTWGGATSSTSSIRVMRFSGMVSVRGYAHSMLSHWSARYPAVADPNPSGAAHAVRVAMQGPYHHEGSPPASQYVPSGHTLRSSYVMPWPDSDLALGQVVISEQALSGTAPAQTSPLPFAKSGYLVTLYVTSTQGPGAPTLVNPVDDIMDLGRAWTLEWLPDGNQTGVRVTRQSLNSSGNPTGSLYYLTSVTSPAWSTTPTTVTTTATSVDFDAGDWNAAGARYRIGVATVDSPDRPDLSPFTTQDVESWAAPTASNPSVGGSLSGGVITNRAPWVQVDGTPGSGATIDRHEVQVVDSTTGEVYAQGAYSGTPPNFWWYEVPATEAGAIPNGVTVTLRGRVRQLGYQWSEWAEAGPYPVSAPRPDAPTVTVGQTTHPTSGLPGLAVTVTSDPGNVTVYRDGAALGTWESTTGTLTVGDYIPPTDVAVSYTATVSTIAALPETSLHSTPATGTLSTVGEREHCWLIDPLDFSAAVQAHCVDFTETIGHPGQSYRPLQASAPVAAIVQSLPHHTPSGDLTVEVDTPDQLDAVKALFTAGRPIMYRRWRERQPHHSVAEHPLQPLRFVPFGDVVVERPASGPLSWRHVSVKWVEQ